MVGSRIYYHEMGRPIEEDVEIFGKGFGPQAGIGAGITDDGRYLALVVFHGSAGQKTEIYYKDLEKDGPIVPIVNDIDAKFMPGYGGGDLYLHTDWEAPKGRVLHVDLEDPARENWKEVIPETEAVIEGISLAGGELCVKYLENVVSKVKVFETDGSFVREIAFPTLGTVSEIMGKWDSDEAFFIFTSLVLRTSCKAALCDGKWLFYLLQALLLTHYLFFPNSKDQESLHQFYLGIVLCQQLQ